MPINSPHKRNKRFASVRDGLALVRKSSKARTRSELVGARSSLAGSSVRGTKAAVRSVDDRMRKRKRNYDLNRYRS